MTVEAYFDGTSVRPLEPVDLKPQQKVFIYIPNMDFSKEQNIQIQKKLDAIHSVFGMLSDDEAQVYADLKRAGTLIEDDDLFIGSSALEHSAVLVTNNAKHLGHIKGLKIEVWGK